jgi:hypothetical protein
MFGTKRPEEHVDRRWIRRGKVRGEGACDVPSTVEKLESVESRRCVRHELLYGERAMCANQIAGEAPNQRRRKERLERIAHCNPPLQSFIL